MIRATCFAAIPAISLACCAAGAAAQDSRLVKLEYDPDQVVRVDGKAKVQATIAFGDDERIENVAIGDSQSWQVTPNKRATLLFVKPLAANAATNMTVVTSRRTYLFDLVASPRAKPIYALRFTYPKEEEAQLKLAQGANEEELAALREPQTIVDPADLNFAWEASGDSNLLPTRSYDDGWSTYLSWPEGRAVPAILIKDFEGTEGPVNFTVRGDTIVVDGVPRQIVLRSGEDVAQLVNNGPPKAERPLRGDALLAANLETQ